MLRETEIFIGVPFTDKDYLRATQTPYDHVDEWGDIHFLPGQAYHGEYETLPNLDYASEGVTEGILTVNGDNIVSSTLQVREYSYPPSEWGLDTHSIFLLGLQVEEFRFSQRNIQQLFWQMGQELRRFGQQFPSWKFISDRSPDLFVNKRYNPEL